MLKVEHVSYRYPNGDRDVLHDVCCTLEDGELSAIVGPSGLKAAGVGVAMGNANPKALTAADVVCGHIDEDGLYHFCKEHNLI